MHSRLMIVVTLLLAAPAPAFAATPCDLSFPSDSTIAWDCVRMESGTTLESRFGPAWMDVARFNRMDRRHAWPGARIRVPRDLARIAGFQPLPERFPAADSAARFVLLDLTEQFLGAYERGRLVHSFPITSGRAGHETPSGEFRIDVADPRHASTMYTMEGTDVPYPMHWALRFHRSTTGVTYWIHGRDLPGYPASHGCVGLTDESMQSRYYGRPADPRVDDARRLFEWAVGDSTGSTRGWRTIAPIPLLVVGRAPTRPIARRLNTEKPCTSSSESMNPTARRPPSSSSAL